MKPVKSAVPERALADEALIRQHATALAHLAARHGVHDLRFASDGRLLGKVDQDRDMLDMVAFEDEAAVLLGASVHLLSDAVVDNPNVSGDLVHAVTL